MGADLYITKITEPLREKWGPIADEAFKRRDRLIEEYKTKNGGKEPPRVPSDDPFEVGWQDKDIQAAHEAGIKAHNEMDSVGYFRDSYNGTALAGACGWSWWQDIVPLQNKNGVIKGKSLDKFRGIIESHPIPSQFDIKEWEKGTTEADILKYFTEKRNRLLAFIDLAKTNGGIEASL